MPAAISMVRACLRKGSSSAGQLAGHLPSFALMTTAQSELAAARVRSNAEIRVFTIRISSRCFDFLCHPHASFLASVHDSGHRPERRILVCANGDRCRLLGSQLLEFSNQLAPLAHH